MIEVNDLVFFTDKCTAIGVEKCRANNTPGKVIAVQRGKRISYLVDIGLGYCVYANHDEIKPFKSVIKKEEVHFDNKEEVICKM